MQDQPTSTRFLIDSTSQRLTADGHRSVQSQAPSPLCLYLTLHYSMLHTVTHTCTNTPQRTREATP